MLSHPRQDEEEEEEEEKEEGDWTMCRIVVQRERDIATKIKALMTGIGERICG